MSPVTSIFLSIAYRLNCVMSLTISGPEICDLYNVASFFVSPTTSSVPLTLAFSYSRTWSMGYAQNLVDVFWTTQKLPTIFLRLFKNACLSRRWTLTKRLQLKCSKAKNKNNFLKALLVQSKVSLSVRLV